MSKRWLQISMGVLGVIPLATGVVGLLGLRDPLYVHFGVIPNVVLDSNLRFFSGVWLGVGLTLVAILRRIERHGTVFRALWAMIFLGGVGRILSVLDSGLPPPPFMAVIGLEIIGAPLFVFWHMRIEQRISAAPHEHQHLESCRRGDSGG
jgi:hypothetical protein